MDPYKGSIPHGLRTDTSSPLSINTNIDTAVSKEGRVCKVIRNIRKAILPSPSEFREAARQHVSARKAHAVFSGSAATAPPTSKSKERTTTASKPTTKTEKKSDNVATAHLLKASARQEAKENSGTPPSKDLKEKGPANTTIEPQPPEIEDYEKHSLQQAADTLFSHPVLPPSSSSLQTVLPDGIRRLMQEPNHGHAPIKLPTTLPLVAASSDDKPNVASVTETKLTEALLSTEKTEYEKGIKPETLLAEICRGEPKISQTMISAHRQNSATKELIKTLPALFNSIDNLKLPEGFQPSKQEMKQNLLKFANEYLKTADSIPCNESERQQLKKDLLSLADQVSPNDSKDTQNAGKLLQLLIHKSLPKRQNIDICKEMKILSDKIKDKSQLNNKEIGQLLRLLAESKTNPDPIVQAARKELEQNLGNYSINEKSAEELYQDFAVIFEQAFLNVELSGYDTKASKNRNDAPNLRQMAEISENCTYSLLEQILSSNSKAEALAKIEKILIAADLAFQNNQFELANALLLATTHDSLNTIKKDSLSKKGEKITAKLREELGGKNSANYRKNLVTAMKKNRTVLPMDAVSKKDLAIMTELDETKDGTRINMALIETTQNTKKPISEAQQRLQNNTTQPLRGTVALAGSIFSAIRGKDTITYDFLQENSDNEEYTQGEKGAVNTGIQVKSIIDDRLWALKTALNQK